MCDTHRLGTCHSWKIRESTHLILSPPLTFRNLITFIKQHDSHHVYIGANRLGKEQAFVKIAEELKYIGTLCVEFFIDRNIVLVDCQTQWPQPSSREQTDMNLFLRGGGFLTGIVLFT